MATEKRLIDANALKESVMKEIRHYWNEGEGGYYLAEDVIPDIDLAPAVDAVEVVRCKECKSWEQYNACDGSKPHRCMNLNAIFHMRTAPDDFCSHGERRTDNG